MHLPTTDFRILTKADVLHAMTQNNELHEQDTVKEKIVQLFSWQIFVKSFICSLKFAHEYLTSV